MTNKIQQNIEKPGIDYALLSIVLLYCLWIIFQAI